MPRWTPGALGFDGDFSPLAGKERHRVGKLLKNHNIECAR